MLRIATPSSFFIVSANVMLYFFLSSSPESTRVASLQFFKSGFSAFGHNVDGVQPEVQSRQFQIDNGMPGA